MDNNVFEKKLKTFSHIFAKSRLTLNDEGFLYNYHVIFWFWFSLQIEFIPCINIITGNYILIFQLNRTFHIRFWGCWSKENIMRLIWTIGTLRCESEYCFYYFVLHYTRKAILFKGYFRVSSAQLFVKIAVFIWFKNSSWR